MVCVVKVKSSQTWNYSSTSTSKSTSQGGDAETPKPSDQNLFRTLKPSLEGPQDMTVPPKHVVSPTNPTTHLSTGRIQRWRPHRGWTALKEGRTPDSNMATWLSPRQLLETKTQISSSTDNSTKLKLNLNHLYVKCVVKFLHDNWHLLLIKYGIKNRNVHKWLFIYMEKDWGNVW